MKRRDFITKNAVAIAGVSMIPMQAFAFSGQEKFTLRPTILKPTI